MDVDEPTWISLEPRNHAVYLLLISFLDDVHTAPATLEGAVHRTIATLLETATQGPDIDVYRFEMETFFGILLTVVKHIAAAAPQQDYLVKLVISIRNTPLPSAIRQNLDQGDREGMQLNSRLSMLIRVLAQMERNAPLHPPLNKRSELPIASKQAPWQQQRGSYMSSSAWTNLNAFIARIHAAVPEVHKLDVRGLFAMIEALEQPLTATPLEDVLPAAAQWIIYAGGALKNNRIPYAFYPDDSGHKRLPWSKGELWTGQHAFNIARWEFWIQRFQEIAGRQRVSETVRLAALQAVEVGKLL